MQCENMKCDLSHTVKKVSDITVHLFPAGESMVSHTHIPAGDGNIANLFYSALTFIINLRFLVGGLPDLCDSSRLTGGGQGICTEIVTTTNF